MKQLTAAQRAQQLKEWAQAEQQFKDTMDLIKHENLPYQAKADFAQNYEVLYPLWPQNCRMISEALESINPEYAGKTKWIVSGVVEWREAQS